MSAQGKRPNVYSAYLGEMSGGAAARPYRLIKEEDKRTLPMAWWNTPVLIAACQIPFLIASWIIRSWAILGGSFLACCADACSLCSPTEIRRRRRLSRNRLVRNREFSPTGTRLDRIAAPPRLDNAGPLPKISLRLLNSSWSGD